MPWTDIYGHDQIIDRFRRSIARGRLASSFLFVGPAGIGKRTFALRLAQALLCETNPEQQLDPCGACPACLQVAAASHPDLQLVAKPADKSFIPVERFIGDRDHRMREGLCHDIALKPFRGGRRMAIIDDADFLNQEGANCLLKTLEEPPPRSLIVLIGTSQQRQLPTIRSRCQVVRFHPLPRDVVAQLLVETGHTADRQAAQRLAELSGGSLQRARELADADGFDFRQSLHASLQHADWDPRRLAGDVTAYVDQAGKDAAVRRERLQQVVAFVAEFYQDAMRSAVGPAGQDASPAAARSSSGNLPAEQAAACVERCVDASGQILANANQATLIECWIDDLATLQRGVPLD